MGLEPTERPPEDRGLRVYPACCTSAFCGWIDCTRCRNKPILDAHKAWVKAHDAVVTDPVWCPLVYVARK